MTSDYAVSTENISHATSVFERSIPAPTVQVFTAFAGSRKRLEWSVPSDTSIIIYDHDNFFEGGLDRFRWGA